MAFVAHDQRVGNRLDAVEWAPVDRVVITAKLAKLRWRAGLEDQVRSEVEGALALYDESRDRITDIYRARALRSIAEAYRVMGDDETARRLYARAVEEGVTNPNSRPRAQDLAATCLSMALGEFDPGPRLYARMVEIRNGLSDPW